MNKYREGKVKSTPTRGVKEYLKQNAYKQSELPDVRYQRPEIRNFLMIETNRFNFKNFSGLCYLTSEK